MLRYAVVLFFHERLDRKWELLCDVVKKDFEEIVAICDGASLRDLLLDEG